MRELINLLPHLARHRAAFVRTLLSHLLMQLGVLVLGLLGAYLLSLALRGETGAVRPLAVVLLLTAVLCALVTWRESYVAHDLAYRVLADLRARVFAALRRALPARHRARRSGDLGAVAMSDVETLEWLYAHTLAQLLVSAVLLAVTGTVSVLISPWLLAAWLPCLLAVAAIPWLFGPGSAREGARLAAASAALQAEIIDTVQGMRELAGAGALDRRRAQLAVAGRALTGSQRRIARRAGAEAALSDLAVAAAGTGALAITAIGGTGVDPTLAPVAFTLAVAALLPIGQLSALLRNVGALHAAAGRIGEVLAMPPAVPEPARSPGPVRGALEFDRVHFRYATTDASAPTVLAGVSFTVRPGETVALVGESGSGKSTCAALALRLWDPDAGAIRIGGVDLRELSDADLRASVSAVPQRIELLTGTVASNIALADPDAAPDRLREAARRAGLLDPASGFPQGVDTPVGEGGRGLSGGQRARVALARALLTDAPVLILDEALAQLDAHAEEAVNRALREGSADRATLVIAHRESTIRAADRVLQLSGGTVRGQGVSERSAT